MDEKLRQKSPEEIQDEAIRELAARVQGGDEEETDFVEFVASREFVARDPEFVVDTPGSVDVLIRLLDEGKISEKTYDDVLRAIATKKES